MEVSIILKGDTDIIKRSFPVPGREVSDLRYMEVKIEQYYWRCLDYYARKHGFTAGFIIHDYEKNIQRHPYDWDGLSDYFVDFLNGCVSAEKEAAKKIEKLRNRGFNKPCIFVKLYTNYDMKDERPPTSNDA